MNYRLSEFVFRTRGVYMFIAIAISVVLKSHLGGTTSLPFLVLGLCVMAVVQVFRMYTASFRWGRQAVGKVEADFLCTSGPYAYVRNPLYLGNFFIGIGLSIEINEWYAYFFFVISYILIYSIVIPHEEKFLERKFGEAYIEYRTHPGKLTPKLKRYRNSNAVIPDIWQASWAKSMCRFFLPSHPSPFTCYS